MSYKQLKNVTTCAFLCRWCTCVDNGVLRASYAATSSSYLPPWHGWMVAGLTTTVVLICSLTPQVTKWWNLSHIYWVTYIVFRMTVVVHLLLQMFLFLLSPHGDADGPGVFWYDNMITSLRKLPYEQRLKECKLTTLEERRKRGDLLETHKIMHGLESIREDLLYKRWYSTKGA